MHFEKVAEPNPKFPLFGWRKIVVPWHIRPGMGRLANPLQFLRIPIPGFPKGGPLGNERVPRSVIFLVFDTEKNRYGT
jgi:hypothetical protein